MSYQAQVLGFSTIFLGIAWMIWITMQIYEHKSTLEELIHHV